MKRIIAITLALLMCLSMVTTTVASEQSQATGNWIDSADSTWGTNGDYTIRDAEDLAQLAKLVNAGDKFSGKKVTLGADIDLAGNNWSPIGGDSVYFAGEFDGNGKTISNLTDTSDTARKGLFGLVEDCYIHDLTLKNVVFSGNVSGARIGALVGNLQNPNWEGKGCIIENVAVDGLNYDITDTNGIIGGLVGYAWNSYVKNCSVSNATMKINSTNGTTVGGMIGYGRGVTDNCYVADFPSFGTHIQTEDINSDGGVINYVDCAVTNLSAALSGTVTFGGFFGSDTYNHWRNYFKNDDVSELSVACAENGTYTVGGFMGGQFGGLGSPFENCSASGTITSASTNENSLFGGFMGYIGGRSSNITDASADVDIKVAGGDVGGFVGEVQMYRYDTSHKNEYSFDGCVANGDVTTDKGNAGGFTSGIVVAEGNGGLDIAITNSEANGNVTGTTAGGFLGKVDDTINGQNYGGNVDVTGSTATGDVTATTGTAGGFAADTSLGKFENCSAGGKVTSASGKADGFVGNASETTEETNCTHLNEQPVFSGKTEGGSTTTYRVTIVYNDGVTADVNVTAAEVTLPTPTKAGHTFKGWSYGGGTLQGGSPFTLAADTTFTAQWTAHTYTIKFDANEGTGDAMADLSASYDGGVTLTKNTYTKSGANFAGWALAEDKTKVVYADGAEVKNLTATDGDTITLYAVWTDKPARPSGGGSYRPSGHLVTSTMDGVDKVYVDGKLVDAKYYSTSGGDVVLSQKFLDGLKAGNHTIKLVYGDRQATGTFTTKGTGTVESAKTFDAGIALYAGMALSSAMGAAYVVSKKK